MYVYIYVYLFISSICKCHFCRVYVYINFDIIRKILSKNIWLVCWIGLIAGSKLKLTLNS